MVVAVGRGSVERGGGRVLVGLGGWGGMWETMEGISKCNFFAYISTSHKFAVDVESVSIKVERAFKVLQIEITHHQNA